MIETIKLNEMGVFPELFLGICIIYLLFVYSNKKKEEEDCFLFTLALSLS